MLTPSIVPVPFGLVPRVEFIAVPLVLLLGHPQPCVAACILLCWIEGRVELIKRAPGFAVICLTVVFLMVCHASSCIGASSAQLPPCIWFESGKSPSGKQAHHRRSDNISTFARSTIPPLAALFFLRAHRTFSPASPLKNKKFPPLTQPRQTRPTRLWSSPCHGSSIW